MDIVFAAGAKVAPSVWSVHCDRALLFNTLHRATTRAAQKGHAVLASFIQPVGPCDPLSIFSAFRQQKLGESFFWEKAEQEKAFVGIGATATIQTSGANSFHNAAVAWRALQRDAVVGYVPGKMPAHTTGPILCGGFAFDPFHPRTKLWEGFPDGLLVLPYLLFTSGAKNAALTVNVMVEAAESIEQLADEIITRIELLHATVEHLLMYPEKDVTQTGQLVVQDILPESVWKALVATAVQHIQQGAYEKVVLARAVQATSENAFAIDQALYRLRKSYPNAYVFAMQRGARYFIGATPERLVFAQDGQIKTMALAGSAPRGATAEEDRQIGMELLHSEKNRREHEFVVAMVRDALANLCSTVEVDEEPQLLKLQNIQHLQTPIRGELLPRHNILEALQDLHPTPAVGGFPRATALAEIRNTEQLDRGWYAGPIGWIDEDGHGEFAVALRSALVDGNKATLFAGCGIVSDSQPESEYAESCLKLKVMLRGLGGKDEELAW